MVKKTLASILKIIKNTKNKVFSVLIIISNNFIDKNIKELFLDIYNYKNNAINILLFITLLPFSVIFILLNLLFFIYFTIFYFLFFIFSLLEVKILKRRKIRIIKCKKRFKFLKNFHLITIEKMIITFPRKKAYLFCYILLKKIIKKEKDAIEKEFILEWFKSISNRYFIVFLIGIPYIVLYCNNCVINVINSLKGFKFENNYAYINTIILNIYKNATPNYTKLVEKLKIKISKNKINFNSYKEFLKASKNKPNFKEKFSSLKKEIIYGSAKNETFDKKFTKTHPTIFIKPTLSLNENNNKIIYANETSKKKLKVWKFMKDVEKESKERYKEEFIENNFNHKGSYSNNNNTFYTNPIETNIENLIIKNPVNDKLLMNDLKNENYNKALASLTINLDKNIIKTKKIIIEGEERYALIKEETEINFLTWIEENQGKISNKSFEALMEINLFWEESEDVIKNLSEENKIKLSEILDIELKEFENPKEVNFKIFISFLSKDLKN